MPTGSTFQITRALRSKIRASKIAASTSTSQPDDNTCNDAREEPVAAPTEKLALVDGGRAKRALEDAESSSVTSLRLIVSSIGQTVVKFLMTVYNTRRITSSASVAEMPKRTAA